MKQNDAVQVYFKLIDIYTRAGEKKNALSLCNEATKKFKKRVAVWELYIQMLLVQSQTDEARMALRRALTVLDKKKHVLMMSKFAILEYVILSVSGTAVMCTIRDHSQTIKPRIVSDLSTAAHRGVVRCSIIS